MHRPWRYCIRCREQKWQKIKLSLCWWWFAGEASRAIAPYIPGWLTATIPLWIHSTHFTYPGWMESWVYYAPGDRGKECVLHASYAEKVFSRKASGITQSHTNLLSFLSCNWRIGEGKWNGEEGEERRVLRRSCKGNTCLECRLYERHVSENDCSVDFNIQLTQFFFQLAPVWLFSLLSRLESCRLIYTAAPLSSLE